MRSALFFFGACGLVSSDEHWDSKGTDMVYLSRRHFFLALLLSDPALSKMTNETGNRHRTGDPKSRTFYKVTVSLVSSSPSILLSGLSLFSIVTFNNELCDSVTTSSGLAFYHCLGIVITMVLNASPKGGNKKGTCFTAGECARKGGRASGNCAAGWGSKLLLKFPNSQFVFSRFGVCCIFAIMDDASVATQNCTYIQNPGYPSTYTSTMGLTYTVKKCDSSERVMYL